LVFFFSSVLLSDTDLVPYINYSKDREKKQMILVGMV
jgi:hypothetical protein